MKIVSNYMNIVRIKEVKIKSKFDIEGITYAIAKSDYKNAPYGAYHYASGQPVTKDFKLLTEVKPALEEGLKSIKERNKYQELLEKFKTLETINL